MGLFFDIQSLYFFNRTPFHWLTGTCFWWQTDLCMRDMRYPMNEYEWSRPSLHLPLGHADNSRLTALSAQWESGETLKMHLCGWGSNIFSEEKAANKWRNSFTLSVNFYSCYSRVARCRVKFPMWALSFLSICREQFSKLMAEKKVVSQEGKTFSMQSHRQKYIQVLQLSLRISQHALVRRRENCSKAFIVTSG